MPVIFWGKFSSDHKTAQIVLPVKGCLPIGAQVTLQGVDGCKALSSPNITLIGGQLVGTLPPTPNMAPPQPQQGQGQPPQGGSGSMQFGGPQGGAMMGGMGGQQGGAGGMNFFGPQGSGGMTMNGQQQPGMPGMQRMPQQQPPRPVIHVTVNVSCDNILTNVSNADRVWYAAQVDLACKPKVCPDGSPFLPCNAKQVCPAQNKFPQSCQATKCEVNPCHGCSPIFSNASNHVCSDICPDKSMPFTCKGDPCSASPKSLLRCPNAQNASFCLPYKCGGCRPQWYDQLGVPICPPPPCMFPGLALGKGTAKLGFGVVNGQCKQITGKKQLFQMIPDMQLCTLACRCIDNNFVDFGNCNQTLGFTLIKGRCAQVSGCLAQKNLLKQTFFDSMAQCNQSCTPPQQGPPQGMQGQQGMPGMQGQQGMQRMPGNPGQQGNMGRRLLNMVRSLLDDGTISQVNSVSNATSTQSAQGNCPNGRAPLQCGVPANILNQTCSTLNCSSSSHTCFTDGCNGCALLVKDGSGKDITSQCETMAPNVCSKVTCPTDAKTDCGPQPQACTGFNIKCIQDKCSCKARWFNADLRPAPPQCAQALSQCFAPGMCPTKFDCDSIDSVPGLQSHPEIKSQLVCMQAPCTCQPMWMAPPFGLRQSCQSTDNSNTSSCCPDKLSRLQCNADIINHTCGLIECASSAKPAKCLADGCGNCSLSLFDSSNKAMALTGCLVHRENDLKALCSKVVCPNVTANVTCGARPDCYPADWKLACMTDPCSCKPMWIDQDLRTNISASCARQIMLPCVAATDCPKQFGCSDLSASALSSMPDQIRSSLVCVQEPCTCRPVTRDPSQLPAGFRLPCGTGGNLSACCSDGQGPQVCSGAAAAICKQVDCNGTKISNCTMDGCNQCALKVMGDGGAAVDINKCRLPFNGSAACPGVTCPSNSNSTPSCGTKPSACPSDWNLRCVIDPCVCNRSIWVDEDLRIATAACSQALRPTCASSCPSDFKCTLQAPLKCIQDPCTCHIIVDPSSVPRGNISTIVPGGMNNGSFPGGLPRGAPLPAGFNGTMPPGAPSANGTFVPPGLGIPAASGNGSMPVENSALPAANGTSNNTALPVTSNTNQASGNTSSTSTQTVGDNTPTGGQVQGGKGSTIQTTNTTTTQTSQPADGNTAVQS